MKRHCRKSMLGPSTPLKNPLDALHRGLRLKASGFDLNIFSLSKKKLQRVNVNTLQRCKKCMHNSREHFWYLLWCGCVSFVICWQTGLSIALQIWTHRGKADTRSVYLSHWTSRMICGRFSHNAQHIQNAMLWFLAVRHDYILVYSKLCFLASIC
jgi:hypothetical protein